MRGGIACIGALAAWAFFGAVAWAQPAADYFAVHEPQRFALVVGNDAYTNFGRLPGSLTDAEQMRDLLGKTLGFKVDYVVDVDTFDNFVEKHLAPFASKISPGDLVVFYFSGHGFAYGANNFLVPTAAPGLVRPSDVTRAFLPESAIRLFLKDRAPGLIIVLLDACRTYAGIVSSAAPPYSPAPVAPAEPPSEPAEAVLPPIGAEGLAKPIGLSSDVIVGFAAEPGKPAIGLPAGQPSTYTKALLDTFGQDGWEFSEVRRTIAYLVRSGTQERQAPYFSETLITEVYLRPTQRVRDDDLRLWKATEAEGDVEKVKLYYAKHRVGPYARSALRWIADFPNGRRPTYSQVSPLLPELAWTAPVEGGAAVVLPKLPSGVGVARILDVTAENALPANVAEATTERLLDLHKQARLTQRVQAQTAAGKQFIAKGIPFSISNITRGVLQGYAVPLMGGDPVAVRFRAPDQAEGLRLGSPYAEISLTPAQGGTAMVVDTAPLLERLKILKAAGREVGWVSITTPKLSDEGDQARLSLQAVQTKQALLSEAAIPGAKISVLEGFNTGEAVRVRIYAY